MAKPRRVYTQTRPENYEEEEGGAPFAIAFTTVNLMMITFSFIFILLIEQNKIYKYILPIFKPICLTSKLPTLLLLFNTIFTYFATLAMAVFSNILYNPNFELEV